MRLLVSVRDSREAAEALAGGAGIIDAKEPSRGPLAPVDPDVLLAIDRAVPAPTMLSVALGDGTASMLPRMARQVPLLTSRPGLAFKAAITDTKPAVGGQLQAACRELATRHDHPFLVVARYVDAPSEADDIEEWIAISSRAGARGFLMDTSQKAGAGMLRILSVERLRALREAASDAGIWFALAGGLRIEDFEDAAAIRPDVVGVRGAACTGGRAGQLSASRVKALHERLATLSRREPVPQG